MNDFLSVVKYSYNENVDVKFKKFINIDINDELFDVVEFQNCEFDNCKIISSTMEKVTFVDSKFTNCDFSNTSTSTWFL